MDKKIIQKAGRFFSKSERHSIIQEMLDFNCSKQSIWEKYTGGKAEHGEILRWMRELGYVDDLRAGKANTSLDKYSMARKKVSKVNASSTEGDSLENLRLERRISGLEKQLKEAELKALAFSTMVDIAEKEFKIPIRKKFNTKP